MENCGKVNRGINTKKVNKLHRRELKQKYQFIMTF